MVKLLPETCDAWTHFKVELDSKLLYVKELHEDS